MLTFTVETAPSARRASAANASDSETDILNELSVWVNVVGMYLILLLNNS